MKLLMASTGESFIADSSKDLHTRHGFVKASELQAAKPGALLQSNTGKKFYVLSAGFQDLYRRIRRGPQIISPKDIAAIIAETGIGKGSTVVDAGAGSGALACFLANIVKKVVTYETRKDFAGIAEQNARRLGLKNMAVKNESIAEVSERNVDLVCLDLPEPWNFIEPVRSALKPGGFLVSYSPHAHQVQEFVTKLPDAFIHIRTIEVIQRNWLVDPQRLRPENTGLLHTGFLTFARRLS